jgi:uncharacterized protein (TIGR02246 family)
MKNTVATAVAVVVLIGPLVEGCAKGAATAAARPDDAAIRSAIEAQMDKILPALAKKDAKAFSAFFTDDATLTLSDASTLHGTAEIEKGATAMFASFDSVTTLPSQPMGKFIVASDSEAVTFATGKATVWRKGKKAGEILINAAADAWKKGSDGTWRISYEVNAESRAIAPPATKKP